MCGEQVGAKRARTFDPERCPLLQGLTSEEADRMMRTDPRMRACIAAVSAGEPSLEPCVSEKAADREAVTPRVA